MRALMTVLIVTIAVGERAQANEGFFYSKDNTKLFEVVVKSEKGQVDEEPGIYFLDDRSGKGKPLVLGHVLNANRVFPGILAYGPLNSQRASAHDAVAVVDNEITVFNRFSDPKKANTSIVIGDAVRGVPVVDVVTGLPVTLPPITDYNDIVIRKDQHLPETQGLSMGGHVMLISLRAPSFVGDGLTFALVLEPGRPGTKPRIYGDRAVLISHTFLSRDSLDRLVVPSTPFNINSPSRETPKLYLYAPNIIAKFKTQIARKSNSPVVKSWLEHLERFETYVTKGLPGGKADIPAHQLALGVPRYDVLNPREFLPMSPVETITEDLPSVFGQVFNHVSSDFGIIQADADQFQTVPIGRNGMMRFIGTDSAGFRQIAHLPIDRDFKTGRHSFFAQSEDIVPPVGGRSYLLFSNKSAYLMVRPLDSPKGSYQMLAIKNPVLAPEDKIEFIRRPMKVNGHAGSVLIIHRRRSIFTENRGRREERVEVNAVTIDEHEGMSIVEQQLLYEGTAPLTFDEMKLRLVSEGGDLLFDRVSPVRGAKRYARDEQEIDEDGEIASYQHFRTTPYEAISHESGKPPKQRWLRHLLRHTVLQDVLTYREYNETGAREGQQASGFYLDAVPGDDPKRPAETYLRGVPLNNYTGSLKDYPSYVLVQKTLYQPFGNARNTPSVVATLVPFDPKAEPRAMKLLEGKKAKKFDDESNSFSLAVVLTPDKVVGVTHFKAWLRRLQIDRPFKSLQFAQLVQGTKNKSGEISVLLFFRQDPKIPGSRDEVLVSTVNLAWSPTAISDPFAAQISGPEQLHDGLVLPTAVHSHLRVNAEGSFFWVHNPGADRQSSQFKVLRLAHPAMGPQRSSSGFSDLREPDEIRQTDVGHVGGKRPVGGRWEIMTPMQLAERVPGLREEGEKRQTKMEKKKRGDRPTKTEVAATPGGRPLPSLGDSTAEQQILANFERALDKYAEPGPDQLRRPRIFVVDESLKDKFKWTLYTKLALDQTPFSIQNTKLRFFQANQSLDDVEVAEELQHIRETVNDKTRVLFMDQAQLHNDGSLTTREYGHEAEATKDAADKDPDREAAAAAADEDDEVDPFPLDHHGARSNMLVLLASGGKAKSLGGLKKLEPRPAPIPMLSIVTPKEWGEIQRDHQSEIQAGVLDDVTLDYNFLTTGWTMWPPNVDKAADDVKALAKRPFRPEEMRVFPTLENILNQAATGELKGKKTIILVPEELKTLVQNQVLIRWATRDGAAGDWNYRNQKLALARINTNQMKLQREVVDNFRALRGAASSRNSVLYADLDTIAKMRRPDQDAFGKQSSIFRLRNPVQNAGNSLFGEFDVRKTGEGEPSTGESAVEATQDIGDLLDPDEFDHDDELDALDEENLTPDLIRTQIATNNETIARLRDAVEDFDRRMEPRESSMYRQTLEHLADRKMYRERLLEVQQRVDEAFQELEPDQKEMAAVSPDPAPHIMYWIASEGEAVQPRPEAGWSVGRSIDPKIATILIGTHDEFETIQTNMTHEAKYFDLRKEFEVISLEAPSDETKFKLVSQLFDRPDVQSLHLSFKLDRDNGLNPRSQLIYKFVNRVDQLAQNPERPIEKTTAFIRAYVALQNALIEDLDLFSHREVSEKFIERLFTKVFPMPLNREILEPNDPLNRLADQDQAVRDLQAAGVEGSPKLKHRIFNTVLSQTRPTDTSRPIPNSQILFGGTSVGKTFFLMRMFSMLNFTAYQPQKTNNEDADYIYVDVSKLTADENSSAADAMPVKEAIENIIDFLAQPKGTRAHIVIDDAHDAKNKEVREKMFGFLRSLFQAPGGMLQVKSKANPGKQFDIPVQNLNLYMTVNPTSNERQRRDFIKEKLSPNDLLKREVLAAISGEGYNIEDSFLARWGDIIDMDKFPRSAKVPELVRRVRAYQVPNGHMVMVDPEVIFRLIDTYPEAHARELLSPATSALTAKPPDVEEGPIYLVSNDHQNRLERDATKPGSVGQDDLAKAVRRSTRVDTIKPEDPIGLVNFMGFVMHNFRLQIFNAMVLEASQKDQLQLSRPRLKDLLRTNFILGMSTHVLDNDRLPVGELVVRPDLFGFYTRGQREELMRYHQQRREDGRKNYFPIELDVRDRRASDSLDAFLSGQNLGLAERRTRKDVLGDTVDKVEAVLLKAMALYLRVHTPEQLLGVGHWKTDEITRWFMELPEAEPIERFTELRAELVGLFNDFEQRLNGPDFEDNRELELYSQVRLFAYVVDKAITRLPWGQITNFVVNVAAASADTSLGPRPSFRNYLSIHQLSAFSIGTPEFMNDMLDSALNDNAYRRSAEDLKQLKTNFFEACQSLLGTAEKR